MFNVLLLAYLLGESSILVYPYNVLNGRPLRIKQEIALRHRNRVPIHLSTVEATGRGIPARKGIGVRLQVGGIIRNKVVILDLSAIHNSVHALIVNQNTVVVKFKPMVCYSVIVEIYGLVVSGYLDLVIGECRIRAKLIEASYIKEVLGTRNVVIVCLYHVVQLVLIARKRTVIFFSGKHLKVIIHNVGTVIRLVQSQGKIIGRHSGYIHEHVIVIRRVGGRPPFTRIVCDTVKVNHRP